MSANKQRRKRVLQHQTYGSGSASVVVKVVLWAVAALAALFVNGLLGGHGGDELGITQRYRERVWRKHRAYFDSLRATLTAAEQRAGRWLNNACALAVVAGILGCVPAGIRFIKEEETSGWHAVQDIAVASGGLFAAGIALQQLLTLLLALLMHSTYTRLTQATVLAMPSTLRGFYISLGVALACGLYSLGSLLLR